MTWLNQDTQSTDALVTAAVARRVLELQDQRDRHRALLIANNIARAFGGR